MATNVSPLSNGGWSKSAMLAAVQQSVIAKLQSVRDIGASVKPLPNDASIGNVQRSAMCFVIANSIEQSGGLSSSDSMQTSRAARLVVHCWVILAGFELQAPRGIFWLAEQIEKALDGELLPIENLAVDIVVYTGGLSFTSHDSGIWQYKMPLSISVPWTTSADKD